MWQPLYPQLVFGCSTFSLCFSAGVPPLLAYDLRLNVGFGSLADIKVDFSYVALPPKADTCTVENRCTLIAKSGHSERTSGRVFSGAQIGATVNGGWIPNGGVR